jgi:hypothetical protein
MEKRGEDCRIRPFLARDSISVSNVCQNYGEKVAKDKIKMIFYLGTFGVHYLRERGLWVGWMKRGGHGGQSMCAKTCRVTIS